MRLMKNVFPVVLMLLVGCSNKANTPTVLAPSTQQPATPSMPQYPLPETWKHANTRQKDRANRSFTELKKRHAPVLLSPLFVDDDEEASMQTPPDVARRVLVLWAVELRAEGVPQDEARHIIDTLQLWAYVSPEEKQFLDNKNPSPEESQSLVWRLESLWVLMWSLGYIEELNWPSGMCDVKKIAGLISKYEDDPKFISEAKLRSVKELLDAQDLTMRIHWSIRDAALHQGGTVPENLDWSGNSEDVPVEMSAAVGVVEQRHYVLNWLLKFMEPETWDDVDTPT